MSAPAVAVVASWAVEALVASALLMVIVLAIRVPVRRLFGPRVAYALWALPALRLALPPLPEAWRGGTAMPVSDAAGGLGAQAASALTYVTVITSTSATNGSASASGMPWSTIVLVSWLVGAAAFLTWQASDYLRFRARVLHAATPVTRIGRVSVVESAGASGPVAFGVLRRVVAFPADFAGRYDAGERDLALAHELGHHARGDLLANWVALATLAFHWWNPAAWAAFRAFRADQEMANDAGVLARAGTGARHTYGCAIVKAAHGRAIGATCHLHSVRDLKGRLKMLNRREGSGARLAAGIVATAGLTLGGLFATASGSAAAVRMKQTVERTTGVDLNARDLLDAVAAFQAEPAMPPAASTTQTRKRVIVTRDGKTQTYEGAAADAYLAANPVSQPPAPPPPPAPGAVPPPPPAPPIPPAPGAAGNRQVRVYTTTGAHPPAWNGTVPPVPPMQVVSRDCRVGPDGPETQTTLSRQKGKTQVTVICTNRIQKMAERAGAEAQRASIDADAIRRNALASAITSLRASRESIAANRSIPDAERAEALKEMDDAITEVEAEARSGG